jgi:hypothetical protein
MKMSRDVGTMMILTALLLLHRAACLALPNIPSRGRSLMAAMSPPSEEYAWSKTLWRSTKTRWTRGGFNETTTLDRLPLVGRASTSHDRSTTTAITSRPQDDTTKSVPLSKIDIGTFCIHFCAAVTMTLPVMIVPMMDAELVASSAMALRGASLAATMASMAPMGNGIGKLVNGLVCQQWGGPKSSRRYFLGSIVATAALASVTLTNGGIFGTSNLGYFVGGIEFFASIQWTICSLFLSQYYRQSPALFARGITILSLSSTGGQIVAKVLAAGLLQLVHWRVVARLCVAVAMMGLGFSLWTSRHMTQALQSTTTTLQAPSLTTTTTTTTHKHLYLADQQQQDQTLLLETQHPNVVQPLAASDMSLPKKTSAKDGALQVLCNPIFWCIGLAHVSGYLTRTSDRVMGIFLQEITSLPRKLLACLFVHLWLSIRPRRLLCVDVCCLLCADAHSSFFVIALAITAQVCGGLTAFMTVGFLHGLITTSKKFHLQSATRPQKLALLRNGYVKYMVAAMGLVTSAAFGKQWHPYVSAAIITLSASVMASSISFPYFQIPNMVSSVYFAPVKPIALSLIDGTGIFLTSPIWKVFTKMLLPTFGWSASWTAVAVIVGLCGTLLMKTVPRILDKQQEQQEIEAGKVL